LGKLPLRDWQEKALARWETEGRKGIVEVVTGGGKTIFALACIEHSRPDTTLIVVPTTALLDQWWEETANFFGLAFDEVHVITGNKSIRVGTVNIAVLNTAAKLHAEGRSRPSFLIVDECHKAASAQFRAALDVPKIGSLGLSATPERQYDDGLNEVLIPSLGPIIYQYDYKEASRDKVIVPFQLRNVVFELEDENRQQYDKLTKSIALAIKKYGPDAPETVSLYLKRTRVLNLSLNRVKLALRLIAANRDKRVLVFHEDIDACNLIHQVLRDNSVKAGIYHSKLTLRERAEMLAGYRKGHLKVLVTCRALDEGFNVPETEIGIIAASTATRRQRIQRLGRVLRPVGGKESATVYTLVATTPEISRLKEEEAELEGVAEVSWSSA
jgi:superfamily II DNA or RNA helicase